MAGIHDVSLLSLLIDEHELLIDKRLFKRDLNYSKKRLADPQNDDEEIGFIKADIDYAETEISEATKELQEVRYNIGAYFSEVLGLRK